MAHTATRVTDVLTREEIRDLVTPTDWEGLASLAVSWGLIAATFWMAAAFPHPLTWLVAIVLLGGRQLGLAILMHETSHRSLFRSRFLNEFAGEWLCAAPTWNHMRAYRTHHLAHHAHTNTDKDTDLGLVAPFPVSRASLYRKLLRDLVGLTGLKRIVGLLMMDFGFVTYTASVNAVAIDQRGRSIGQVLSHGFRQAGPVLLTNGILFAILFLAGHGWLYLLWVAAWLTTYSLFMRVRAIAEHACTSSSTNPFENTRTTYANLLARCTVAPHHVNYHLEHHLLMTVPHYRLPKMHRMLKQRGALTESPVASGYLEVLRMASTG
ncbi:Fatty acid desaturase family protein [Sulfidibacter corallicola]|uniref:Fatty acid desaturase family protein n=1 Tax=Sulfidibacter corallicola TaxID=2818388 RepID=A0A8A4TNG0_SULCO|nr:fatty acid desaturase family protein [Sulfidibacter corallicola]QTD50468.1 fatty acid desaturase family protein [Sulfidibacter corallicola]